MFSPFPMWKDMVKVKCMHKSGTEAIRTQLQPSKPKRKMTNITNSHYTKRVSSYFPKGSHSAIETELKII